MKEHPWHLPSVTAKHFHRFRNLADFHHLTLAWLEELKEVKPSHLMTRGPHTHHPEIAANFWMLDSLSEVNIEPLLDDTSPDDFLGRLDQTVWALQAWALLELKEKTPKEQRSNLFSILQQCAWNVGRKCAENRWGALPVHSRQDLRVLLYALADSPMSGSLYGNAFLIRRAIANEIQIELKICPHLCPHTEVAPSADDLCQLHTHWIKGFLYTINNQISVEHQIEKPRCIHRWMLNASQDLQTAGTTSGNS